MVAAIPDIDFPEIFIGFVAPIGIDLRSCVKDFSDSFQYYGYRVVEIKVTEVFNKLSPFIRPKKRLKEDPLDDRYTSYISYGDQLRAELKDDAILSALCIGRITKIRGNLRKRGLVEPFSKVCYLLHQFKRKEEIDLLRSVYGPLFFQVSAYSRRGARVDYLAHRFANNKNSANINEFRSTAEKFIQTDENESEKLHGQRVGKIFSEGDFIINMDMLQPSRTDQIHRFTTLLFGSNFISPSKAEYGMFIAKAAALRTLDLSRQVGAAIFTIDGEIISMGSNEVPKGEGGTYWSDGPFDDREFKRSQDTNERRKREVLQEVIDISLKGMVKTISASDLKESQFMDSLEYGRIVHAEMSAIVDAARIGKAVKGGVLYCTTFPCHLCAKHIVAAGISKLVFLEPYPKSLILDLHSDSISIEHGDRGQYQSYPAVSFEHFSGISPRRYRELFERGKRKDRDGTFRQFIHGTPRPCVKVNSPFYANIESIILSVFIKGYRISKGINVSILDGKPSNGDEGEFRPER